MHGLVITNFLAGAGLTLQIGGSILIAGNCIGTDATGTLPRGNRGNIAVLDSHANTIGGLAPEARNVIAGSTSGVGILIKGSGASANLVQGNFIGTDTTGTVALSNDSGVAVSDAPGNTIGGTVPEARNVIAGNRLHGVSLAGAGSTRNIVQGNAIGTQADGLSPLGNLHAGVSISGDASNNTIGDPAGSAGNTVAFNILDGVAVSSGTGNAIRANTIFANLALGIDLDPLAVTPNDPGDSDTGANLRQNFPVLTVVGSGGGETIIQGTLNSAPATAFTLEFFANSACDPSGFGEGETVLGTTHVTTDGGGNASFTVTFPTAVALTQAVTATATDPGGNTSEFAQCAPVVGLSDLTLTQTVVPAPAVTAGLPVTYTLTITNNGPSAATNVQLTDTLPADVTMVAVTPEAPTCTVSGSVVTCSLGALSSGSSVQVIVDGTVSATATGSLSNTASVTSTDFDPQPTDNLATALSSVTLSADLQVSISAVPEPVVAGTGIT